MERVAVLFRRTRNSENCSNTPSASGPHAWAMRQALLLATLLLTPAQAAPNTPVKTSFGVLPVTPGDDDAALALRAPAFAGLWVEGKGVALAVTSTDPAARQRVLAEVEKRRGADLKTSGHTLAAPRFVPVQYSAVQLSQARFLARGLRGWNEIYVDVKANKLHIAFQHAAYRQQAADFFRQKGIPADALDLVAEPSPTLPPRSTLSQPHRAALNVPAQVAQGDVLPLSFKLTNTGSKPISLARGCFTFKYRVLNAMTGAEVRPVPAPGACPDVAYPPLVVASGQTGELIAQGRWPVFWDLLDTRGQVVPPGKYVLQAAYGQGKDAVRAPDVTFTVRPATPESTMRKALQVFSPSRMVQSIEYDVKFAVQSGVPKLLLTVPDARARDAVQAVAKKEGVSLARLNIWVKPAPPLPPVGQPQAAELKVSRWPSPQGMSFGLRFRPLNVAAVEGAKNCTFVAAVRDARSGEVVFARQSQASSRANHCPARAGERLDASWNARHSDGTLAPASKYEGRAGLLITGADGQTRWLSAAPKTLDWDGKSGCIPEFCSPE